MRVAELSLRGGEKYRIQTQIIHTLPIYFMIVVITWSETYLYHRLELFLVMA